jgi:hypothetical protein
VVELGRHVGSAHGGVGSGADDDIVPGFGGGISEVPGLGSDGGGLGGGAAGSRSWLMANARGRQNGPLTSWAAAMDGQGPCGGRQADDPAYWQGDGDGADSGEIGSGGGGYDGGGHSAGFGGGGIAQAEPAGADAIENSSSHKFCSHARIYIFLSFFDARFAKNDKRRVRRIST